jgi:hypothetical protein
MKEGPKKKREKGEKIPDSTWIGGSLMGGRGCIFPAAGQKSKSSMPGFASVTTILSITGITV